MAQTKQRKFGRLPRTFDPGVPHFSTLNMMKAPAAPIPVSHDWATGMPTDLGFLMNDSLGDCTCFPAGTLIRMVDGTSTPIEKMRLLDKVVTAERNESVVTAVMCKEINENLIRVHAWGHTHLRLTKEHPILTKRGYVRAEDLTSEDWIALPSWHQEGCDTIFPQEYFTHEETRLIRTSGEAKDHKQSKTIVKLTAWPEALKLTPKFGRLIGLFLAEGSTNQNTVRWTFGSHEIDTLAKETINLLNSELDAESILRQRPNGTIDVVLCGKHWRMLFEKLCSKGAGKKTLHPDIWAGSDDFLKAIFNGWMDGDGYSRDGGSTGTTISHRLASDMYNIAQLLGWRPSINVRTPSINGNVKHRCDRWDVNIRNQHIEHNDNLTNRSIWDNGITWRKIKEITKEMFNGYVFNLSVKGDESYIAEGVGVHNCAAVLHAQQVWTYNTGTMDVVTDAEALWMYENWAGYVPGDPSTDQGANEQTILTNWMKGGFPDTGTIDHLSAFIEIDPRNLNDVRQAIYDCGLVYIGFEVPISLENNDAPIWKIVPGQSQIVGGHAIVLTGYDATTFSLISWGKKYKMTTKFFSKFTDEVYALVDQDWVTSTGSTPLGLSLQTLTDQMKAL